MFSVGATVVGVFWGVAADFGGELATEGDPTAEMAAAGPAGATRSADVGRERAAELERLVETVRRAREGEGGRKNAGSELR